MLIYSKQVSGFYPRNNHLGDGDEQLQINSLGHGPIAGLQRKRPRRPHRPCRRVVLEPPHLDPTAGAAAAIDEVVYANLFEGLTRIDEKGQVQPDLAESWTVSDDGKVYTFKLHSA
jgi:hypothetical protein